MSRIQTVKRCKHIMHLAQKGAQKGVQKKKQSHNHESISLLGHSIARSSIIDDKTKSSSLSYKISELTRSIQHNDKERVSKILYDSLLKEEEVLPLIEGTLFRFPESHRSEPASLFFQKEAGKLLLEASIRYKNASFLSSRFAKTAKTETLYLHHLKEIMRRLEHETTSEDQKNYYKRLTEEILSIKEIDPAHHTLSLIDSLALCIRGEKALESCAKKTNAIYLRRSTEQLPRSMVVDCSKKTFTILSKDHGSFFAEGAFKWVSDAVEIDIQKKHQMASRCVRVVNNLDHELSKREIEFEKKFGNIKSVVTYPSKSDPDFFKTTIITNAFDHDLYPFTAYVSEEKHKTITLDEIVEVLYRVSKEIRTMHKNGACHRDVKAKNILYRKNNDGSLSIKLCDYGHAFYPSKEEQKKLIPKRHGTLRYSPPEVIENKKLQMSPFIQMQKLDMYGLGNLLFELLFVEPVPWGHDAWAALKKEGEKKERATEKALAGQNAIFDLLEKKKQNITSSRKKALILLCQELLDPNPYTRIDSDTCYKKLKEIRSSRR